MKPVADGAASGTILHRCAALALLAVLLAAIWLVLAAPVLGLVSSYHADIALLDEQRTRLHAMLGRGPALVERQRILATQIAEAGGLWATASTATVAAAIQDRLRQAVAAAGGVVKSTSEIRGATELGSRRVRVGFRIEGPLSNVRASLVAIDAARPAIFVDMLTIVAPQGGQPADRPPVLLLDLEVSVYLAAPAS